MEPTSSPKSEVQISVPLSAGGSSSNPQETFESMLVWARLLRVGKDLRIDSQSLDSIESSMLEALGMEPGPAAVVQPKPPLDPALQAENALEQKLRHLIEASAPWESLKPVLLKLIQGTASPQMAARCCEVALIHGPPETHINQERLAEIHLEVIASAYGRHPSFYLLIHQALRLKLVLQNFRSHHSKVLDQILVHFKDHDSLTPLERLYLFIYLSEGNDTVSAYMYFKRYQKHILQSAKTYQDQTGILYAQVLLTGGKLALKLGYIQESRETLALIDEHGVEYETALRLLLDHRFLQPSNEPSYLEQIIAASTVDARLSCLQSFFDSTRRLGGFQDRHRPELNDLLMAPFDWMGDDVTAWAKVSKLLVANSDLENLLPNLYQVFRDNALQFHRPDLDHALWEGPRQSLQETHRDRYWRGVGLLHFYLTEGPQEENFLWQAKTLVEESLKNWHHSHLLLPGNTLINLPFEWKELHKYGYSYTAKNNLILEVDRMRMLVQLRICQNQQIVTIKDIESYLALPFSSQNRGTSPEIFTRLLSMARQHPQLEHQILLRRAALTHLTNQDLDRLWHLGQKTSDSDLSWRCATLIKCRGSLSKQVLYAWNISGEKRSHYPIMIPSKAMVLGSIKDLSPSAHRFLHALLVVGPRLPELLHILDAASTTTRPKSYPSGSPEHKIKQLLAKIPWLPQPGKKYIYHDGRSNLDRLVPPFANLLPTNPWSMTFNYVCESLGIYAWNWSLKDLGHRMSLVVARIASRQGLQKQPLRVTKWLRALTPEERTAWQDLASLARIISDDECVEALGFGICRWTMIILQNHAQGIESLMQMRAPAAMIWDLEQFVLGEFYGEIRSIMKTRSKIMIPAALQQLQSIIQS